MTLVELGELQMTAGLPDVCQAAIKDLSFDIRRDKLSLGDGQSCSRFSVDAERPIEQTYCAIDGTRRQECLVMPSCGRRCGSWRAVVQGGAFFFFFHHRLPQPARRYLPGPVPAYPDFPRLFR